MCSKQDVSYFNCMFILKINYWQWRCWSGYYWLLVHCSDNILYLLNTGLTTCFIEGKVVQVADHHKLIKSWYGEISNFLYIAFVFSIIEAPASAKDTTTPEAVSNTFSSIIK